MTRARVPETDAGIHGEGTVDAYDAMQRRLRDKGWIETRDLIDAGITTGAALEIGPGPGYLGLEWLATTQATTLKGLDISADMIAVAERNASAYRPGGRAEYVLGSADALPFPDASFDAVFTASSLHEWSQPEQTLRAAWRVLKPEGRLLVLDFRRDTLPPLKWFLWLNAKPKTIRPGLLSSLHAAYTPAEATALVARAGLSSCCQVADSPMGLKILGTKTPPA
jgi:ubiquinone/menaquinone biosynthesis C-methylase UbiE